MSIIKHIGSRLFSLYSLVDPLVWQNRYASNSIKTKKKYIELDAVDTTTTKKIKEIWGWVSDWHRFYYSIGDKSKGHLYFPDGFFYDIIDRNLNDWKIAPVIDDKSLYDLLFHDVSQPRTIARFIGGVYMDSEYQIISFEDVIKLCEMKGSVIIKVPYGSSGGHGIKFWHQGDTNDLKKQLNSFNSFVIQEIVIQHNELAKLHPQSLNTIRIMTITLDGQVKILSSIVRMGIGNSRVDNVSSGGLACGVKSDGSLKSYAFDGHGHRYDKHPQGARFQDSTIPNYYKIVSLSKHLAPRLSRFSKLISWDFAVDTKGQPLLIEANLCGGELDFHQMCNGPIFGDEETTKAMLEKFYKVKTN